MNKIINLFIKLPLYGLVFLMPLFWLPFTVEVYEFSKQYLLIFLVSIAFLAWLAKLVIVRKKFFFRRTALDIWILAFMIVSILSAVFSIDKVSSWLGFYGRFSDSVIGLIALVVLYFLVVNNVRRVAIWGISLSRIYNLFFISTWIVVITTYLSLFNLWSKIPWVSQVMQTRSFNLTSASLGGLAIFLVMVVSLIIGLILSVSPKKSEKRGRWVFLMLASLILLVVLNFSIAWMVLGITMFVLLVMAFWTRLFREKVNLLALPIILLFISAFYWFGIPAKVSFLNELNGAEFLSQEISLDSETSKAVIWQTLKERPVLGSGPGTFMHNFVQFKPVEFNNTNFWNVRFDKGKSQLGEMVATTGILGILSFAAIIGMFLLMIFLGLRKITKKGVDESRFSAIFPFLLAWIVLLVAQLFYMTNTLLSFYFWFFTALVMVDWQRIRLMPLKKLSFSFKKLPEVGLVMNVFLLILVFSLITIFYLGGRFYLADVSFKQALLNPEQMTPKIERTVALNNYREDYRRALSQVYLNNAWVEANKLQEEQNIQLLQAYITGSIEQARTAVGQSPNSVVSWENLAAVYRDARGLVGGTQPFAVEAFARAVELEPNNPFFYRELCRLSLIEEQVDWDKTVNYCQKSVSLKENYLDAHIQLALAYEQKGDLEIAVEQMEKILGRLQGVSFERGSDLAGAATEIYFQLGRLHFNLDNTDDAIRMFEQAVIVTPQYANARYALGLAYESAGRSNDALIQFQIVDQLVPGNESVQSIIQQLTQAIQPQPEIEIAPGPESE